MKALMPPLEISTRRGWTNHARQARPSSRLEVSADQSSRDRTPPRGLSESSGGFSQPEEINDHHRHRVLIPWSTAGPVKSHPLRRPGSPQSLNVEHLGHTPLPENSAEGGRTRRERCVRTHTQQDAGQRESPGRQVLPGLIEPPVGIEPTTYSLRVNRSAD